MKWLRAYLERREKLAERVAVALERGAERGPSEDSEARQALWALTARVDALDAAVRALGDRKFEDAAARGALNGIAQRLSAVEAKREATDPARFAAVEAVVERLRSDLRSLRGKVYRDPEFHKPAPKSEDEPEFGAAMLPGVL